MDNLTPFQQRAKILLDRNIPVVMVRPGEKGAFESEWQNNPITSFDDPRLTDPRFVDCNTGAMAQAKIGDCWFFEIDDQSVLERIKAESGHDLVSECPTLMVRSRMGRGHFYFAQTEASIKMGNLSQTYVQQGDWSARVSNAYVVGPLSFRQKEGTYYEVVQNVPICEAPQWLIDWCISQKVEKKAASKDDFPRNEGGKVPHGYVHGYLVHRAGVMRQAGMDIDLLEEQLLRIVHEDCEEPINDAEVKQKARSFDKYEKGTTWEEIALSIDISEKAKKAATQQVQQQAAVDVSKWRDQFRSVGQMDSGPIVEIIKGVLQEGVCFIGANPGDGKTLVSLAFAKAICTGEPLFGLSGFKVPQTRQVIYLIPESRDRAFRRRCEAFKIPDNPSKFLARTTSMGATLPLNDPYLMQAVKETNAVVFLDTAARFMKTNDENSAAQNQALVNDVFTLLQAGAICVVLVHHATKASANEAMTLENMLRGTGDFAAMCDQAYGIRKDRVRYANGNGPMEIDLVSLKDREQIGELTHLRLAASKRIPNSIIPIASIIDMTGNFKVIDKMETHEREIEALLTLIKADPTISAKDLAKEVGDKERTIKAKLLGLGWHRSRGGKDGGSPWHQDINGKCPFEVEAVTKEVAVGAVGGRGELGGMAN